MYRPRHVSIQNLNTLKKKCTADSVAGGQPKKGNRETRREKRKEDVSEMGCIHTHFYTEIKQENMFIGLMYYTKS